jgi:ABC-type transporter Mla maintaining outer membrane lipid asymmetry permease subunit MlaE
MSQDGRAYGTVAIGDKNKGTGLGIVSVIFGIFGWMPLIGVIAAIIGLVTGVIARRQAKSVSNYTGKLLATTGFVISCVTLVVSILMLMWFGTMLGSMGRH